MDFGACSRSALPSVERGQGAVGITGNTGLFKQLLKFSVLYNLSLIRACFLFGRDG